MQIVLMVSKAFFYISKSYTLMVDLVTIIRTPILLKCYISLSNTLKMVHSKISNSV